MHGFHLYALRPLLACKLLFWIDAIPSVSDVCAAIRRKAGRIRKRPEVLAEKVPVRLTFAVGQAPTFAGLLIFALSSAPGAAIAQKAQVPATTQETPTKKTTTPP